MMAMVMLTQLSIRMPKIGIRIGNITTIISITVGRITASININIGVIVTLTCMYTTRHTIIVTGIGTRITRRITRIAIMILMA